MNNQMGTPPAPRNNTMLIVVVVVLVLLCCCGVAVGLGLWFYGDQLMGVAPTSLRAVLTALA